MLLLCKVYNKQCRSIISCTLCWNLHELQKEFLLYFVSYENFLWPVLLVFSNMVNFILYTFVRNHAQSSWWFPFVLYHKHYDISLSEIIAPYNNEDISQGIGPIYVVKALKLCTSCRLFIANSCVAVVGRNEHCSVCKLRIQSSGNYSCFWQVSL